MTVLDEAYERLQDAWLEDQRGFVNHGPMSCEALFANLFRSRVVVSQIEAAVADHTRIDRTTVATCAARTGDVHAVKLTEAALRGLDATGDPIFAAAAETVTGWA
jgi:hypothetical protein